MVNLEYINQAKKMEEAYGCLCTREQRWFSLAVSTIDSPLASTTRRTLDDKYIGTQWVEFSCTGIITFYGTVKPVFLGDQQAKNGYDV